MLIGLLGGKQYGKDSAARVLLDLFGFRRIGYADELYRQVAKAFGVTPEFLMSELAKTVPQQELALGNCDNRAFTEIAIRKLRAAGETGGPGELRMRPRTSRFLVQTWGTEYVRDTISKTYWVDIVRSAILASPGNWVVTDVRYFNEVAVIEDLDGQTWRIHRPAREAIEAAERKDGGDAAHRSETELRDYVTDQRVTNIEDGGAYMRKQIVWIMDELLVPAGRGELVLAS